MAQRPGTQADPTQFANYVIADNNGHHFAESHFEQIDQCPSCGGELLYGSSINVRMQNMAESSMVTDIDSGQKVTGDFRGKTCTVCHYVLVMIDIFGYEGY